MRFEFHLNSGKKAKKRNKTKSKLSKLFKKKESHYEIVKGTPIETDMFGKTTYQNINGVFRAMGDEYPLYANIEQRENELISLAPPREEDEEDTRRPEKPAKDIGTWIIVPSPKFLWDICYVTGFDYRVAVTTLPLIAGEIDMRFIFDPNNPVYGDKFQDIYINRAFGFFDKTALVSAELSNYDSVLYKIDYEGHIVKGREEQEYWRLYDPYSNYTIYNGKFYFAISFSYTLQVWNIDKELNFQLINEYSTETSLRYGDIWLWKNFLIFRTSKTKIVIYDFIDDNFITTINILSDLKFIFADFNDETACFIVSKNGAEYISPSQLSPEQHCILLNKNGNVKDIKINGYGMYSALDKDRLALYSYIPGTYAPSARSKISITTDGENIFCCTSDDYGAGGYLYKSLDGKSFSYVCYISTSERERINYLYIAPDGHLWAMTNYNIYRAKDETCQEWDVISLPRTPLFEGNQPMIASDGGFIFIRGTSGWMYSNNNGLTWNSGSGGSAHFTIYIGGGTIIGFADYPLGYYEYFLGHYMLEPIPVISFDYGNTWNACSQNLEGVSCRFDNTHLGGCRWNRGNCPLGIGRCLIVPEKNPPEDCQGYEDGCPFGLTGRESMPDTYCYGTKGGTGYVAQAKNNPSTIYMTSSHGFLKSTDGKLFHYYMTIPLGYQIKEVYDSGGRVLISFTNGVLYSGTSYLSTQTGGYLHNFCEFGDKIFAIFVKYNPDYNHGERRESVMCSEDGGLTWINIQINTSPQSNINIYSKSGDSFILSNEYKDLPCDVYEMQGTIGDLRHYAGLYGNKFYFGYPFSEYIFNISSGEISHVPYNSNSYANLFLDNFRFYYGYDEGAVFYVEDLKTNIKYKLITEAEYGSDDLDIGFHPEHKANYYLR